MPSSTKWRLRFTACNAGDYIGVGNVTMSATPGSANLCVGGTASASSVYNASYQAAYAFDGNVSSYWSSANLALPIQLQYDFPSAVDIGAYSIQAESGGGYTPKSWTLEYWDGSAWQVTNTIANETGWGWAETRSYPLVSKQRWRINVSAVFSGAFVVIAQIQLRTVAGGANQATGYYQAVGTTTAGGTHPGHAFDGNPATQWSSNAAAPQWIRYWFAGANDIVEYVVGVGTLYLGNYVPKSWTLEYWDGAAWIVADTQTSVPAWSANESRTYSVASAGGGAVESTRFYVTMP